MEEILNFEIVNEEEIYSDMVDGNDDRVVDQVADQRNINGNEESDEQRSNDVLSRKLYEEAVQLLQSSTGEYINLRENWNILSRNIPNLSDMNMDTFKRLHQKVVHCMEIYDKRPFRSKGFRKNIKTLFIRTTCSRYGKKEGKNSAKCNCPVVFNFTRSGNLIFKENNGAPLVHNNECFEVVCMYYNVYLYIFM